MTVKTESRAPQMHVLIQPLRGPYMPHRPIKSTLPDRNEIDRMIADFAVRFLTERARRPGDRPWLLYVGFFRPHFPLLCDERYFDRYHPDRVEIPDSRDQPIETQHPVVQSVRRYLCDEQPLSEETVRTALAAYYGLVTFTDELIGAVHQAAEAIDQTTVLYTSDHGESGGAHGMWQKHCFYEHAVRVPLVMCGPGVAPGGVVSAPVSLVDVLPTLLQISEQEPDPSLPGTSLMPLATGAGSRATAFRDRPVLSEYHAGGWSTPATCCARAITSSITTSAMSRSSSISAPIPMR